MLNSLFIEDAVRAALREDLGHGHDVTSQAIISSRQNASAAIRARESGRLAGLVAGLSAFMLTDPDFEVTVMAEDGDDLEAGQDIALIEGPAREMMIAERTALNFMCHLSGVATLTAQYVKAIQGTDAKIMCTRKTLPGLRAFQKYAVRIGGGYNHRHGLDDAILIKDNHIIASDGINAALEKAVNIASHVLKIEIEVDTIDQLLEVLKFNESNSRGADIVMLDNMSIDTLKEAIALVKGKIITEASGGVNINTVSSIAKTGIDYISVGALTQSATALDIGLDMNIGSNPAKIQNTTCDF